MPLAAPALIQLAVLLAVPVQEPPPLVAQAAAEEALPAVHTVYRCRSNIFCIQRYISSDYCIPHRLSPASVRAAAADEQAASWEAAEIAGAEADTVYAVLYTFCNSCSTISGTDEQM